ncbi:serine protease, putative [Trichomonas vaginalis G3]|uniref:receptor protein-tyrosine kinase n=1 Tax=Trichomonas vaginalis (strain ATCC PRA-98 / G3) TaxID=412133 RepID=A2FH44_TRIV3|nr:glycine-rich protein family [Trichomonas vaginalis G3]EAX95769.1 serine protease, putative [Trichomonas vaginalis G3]KAI5515012.1 glycine-rich protein family [Trichomonas vaginalis G3]|eukprot:XP_001308699.1 serine protease [Trichomonas vaginalis G3]
MKILLISGAGGGSGSYNKIEYFGSFGGPFASDSIGTAFNISETDAKKVRGKGATFSRPGEGGFYVGTKKYPTSIAEPGKYLKGGNSNTSARGSSGGGGAGYYGGGGGTDLSGGGGGSSFASYELYNVILLGGDKIFLSPTNQTEEGHFGHGHIRIEPANPYTIDKIQNKCTNKCDLSPYLSIRLFFHSFNNCFAWIFYKSLRKEISMKYIWEISNSKIFILI